jgi:hypothetical protein
VLIRGYAVAGRLSAVRTAARNIFSAHLKLLEQLDVLVCGCVVVGRLSAVGAAAAPTAPARLPALPRLPTVLLPDPVNLVVHLVVSEPDRTSTVCNTGIEQKKKKQPKTSLCFHQVSTSFMLSDTTELGKNVILSFHKMVYWCTASDEGRYRYQRTRKTGTAKLF